MANSPTSSVRREEKKQKARKNKKIYSARAIY
jgi:hypothetical protein